MDDKYTPTWEEIVHSLATLRRAINWHPPHGGRLHAALHKIEAEAKQNLIKKREFVGR